MNKYGLRCLALAVFLLTAVLGSLAQDQGQDLVKEALASFPLETVRLEYSSPAKLRQLPEYARLHERYLGPSLRSLEAHLKTLGVGESDLDEVVLGWQPGSNGLSLEGVAYGKMDPQAMARNAAAAGITATPLGSVSAYCFGTTDASTCVAVLGRGLGGFGSLQALRGMVDVRRGETAGLGGNPSFSSAVSSAHKDAPLWGVAVGSAIEDWFKSGLPVQKNLPVDLSTLFKNVQSLTYSIQPTDRVHLSVDMSCTSAAAASSLRQQFEALRLFQKVAWQQQYPNVANPFEDLAANASGSTFTLSLSSPYSALEASAKS
jgi:hypothetical protein